MNLDKSILSEKINLFAGEFLNKFFDSLNEGNISFVVLRNYEGLPYNNNSKDVDFLINKKDISKATKVLTSLAKNLGFQIIKKTTLDYLHCYVLVKKIKDQFFSIKIDLFKDLTWRGIHFVKSPEVLSQSIKSQNFFIPKPGHQALIMVLYYSLYARKIRTKYHSEITTLLKKDKSSFYQLGEHSLPKDLLDKIYLNIENSNFDFAHELRSQTKLALIKNNFGFGILGRLLTHFYSELLFKLKKGPFIVFLGPDGVGKSTVLNEVVHFYASLGMCSAEIPGHFIPEEIPPLHKLFFAPKKLKNQDYTKPYEAKPVGKLSSLIRVSYYFLAFYIGYLFFIKKRRRQNTVVFYDRYFHDLIADPHRYRISLKNSLVNTLFKLQKRPSLIITITALAETVFKRKQELTIEKIKELASAYEAIGKNRSNHHLISNDDKLEVGVSNIILLINKNLQTKA